MHPDIYPREIKTYFQIKPVYRCFSNFICNKQISVYGWMIKQSMVYPYYRILLNN